MISSRRAMFGLLVGGLLFAAVACGDDSTSPPEDTTTVAELQGKTYEAVGASGGITLPEASKLTMSFLATKLSISGGCNTMSGNWRIEDNRLMVVQLAQTQMACADDLMALDAQVTQLVTSQPVVAVTGDQMTLTKGDDSINFREAVKVDDQPLEGTKWTVTGTVQGDATSSLDTDPATIVFSAGTAEVFAGCNTGSASYTATDTTIEFGPLALTKMACEAPATTLEATVTAVLAGTVTYDIEGTKLTLAAADGTGLTLTSKS